MIKKPKEEKKKNKNILTITVSGLGMRDYCDTVPPEDKIFYHGGWVNICFLLQFDIF